MKGSAVGNPTVLRPGMPCRIKGQAYELRRRYAYRAVVRGRMAEWQDYELAAGADRHFLEWGDGRWTLYSPFEPRSRDTVGPAVGSRVTIDDPAFPQAQAGVVTGSAQARVEVVDGKATGATREGDRFDYVDIRAGGRPYSVVNGREYYRGKPLSSADVMRMFGLQDKVHALDAATDRQKRWGSVGVICLAFAVLAFVGWAGTHGSGRPLVQGTVALESVPADGAHVGPFTLGPGRGLYRLELGATLNQAECLVGGAVESPEVGEFAGKAGTFYDFSGSDYDGYWHEWSDRTDTEFRIRGSGPFRLNLYAESEAGPPPPGTVSYRILGGVVHGGYFLTYGLLALLAAIALLAYANPRETGALLDRLWEAN